MIDVARRNNALANRLHAAAAESDATTGQPPEEANDVDGARAAENIAEWRKYLPQDCVDAMVKDGWHRSV